MNFEVSAPVEAPKESHQGWIGCSLAMLHQFLRLPQDVKITGLRMDPTDARSFIIDLEGTGLPGPGESVAAYKSEHHIIPKFDKFTLVVPKQEESASES